MSKMSMMIGNNISGDGTISKCILTDAGFEIGFEQDQIDRSMILLCQTDQGFSVFTDQIGGINDSELI